MNNLARRIRNRVDREFSLLWLLRLKSREFRNNRNNNLRLVEEGFLNRESETSGDTAILRRIVDAYNKAKDIQRSAVPCYQVSNEWLPVYERSLREVIKTLADRDIEKVGRIYRNFMRNSCSTGLHGMPVDMQKCYFGNRISRKYKQFFLYDCLSRYELWKDLLGNTCQLSELASPNVGNPYGYFIDGTFIRVGADYLHYYATAVGRLLRGTGHRTVVELGGGYGGMAYYLARDNDNLSYVDFDLPENMALAAYYLLSAFPEKKILLFGESELTPESIRDYQIIIMPNFEITRLSDNSVDLVFNSYSLAEMSAETIHNYIAEFTRIVRGYFLHVNHNRDSEVVADNFGVDPRKFDLLYKVPALWNKGRKTDMDEYEYLYRKVSD